MRRHVRAAGVGLARGGKHCARLRAGARRLQRGPHRDLLPAGDCVRTGGLDLPAQRWVSIALGVALLLGLLASRRLALWRPVTSAVNQLKSGMSVLLRRRSFAALGALGLLNGLLPCGLVYVACAGAAVTGGVFAGARYMAAFGAGTVPMMLAISLSGKLVPASLRLKLVKTIPVCVFLLGTLLILRGMSLGIPYLSPDMSGSGASCCHR